MRYRSDCYYFKGDQPCDYHKKSGENCTCKHYRRLDKRILIIKLAALGDVIRTTPILRKLKEVYPHSEITWVTYSPEILPVDFVEVALKMDNAGVLRLLADRFDILYNFDKDKEACALAALVKAKVKKGFTLRRGKCAPFNKGSMLKLLKGLDDSLNMASKESYQQDIFRIAGFKFNQERYIIEKKEFSRVFPVLNSTVIGLNTGCGQRWLTRLWPLARWVELAKKLKAHGYGVLLLGGEVEDSFNRKIAEEAEVAYLGYLPIDEFIGLVDKCELVVTAVSMAMHIAVALEKKVVLLNNIFNRHEFYLYGLGAIIEPEVPCKGCYKGECEKKCMESITAEQVFLCATGLLGK